MLRQPPQLVRLYRMFTHRPRQHRSPYLHLSPHRPQLRLSVLRLTQRFLQQYRPGLPFMWHTFGFLSQVMAARGFFRPTSRRRSVDDGPSLSRAVQLSEAAMAIRSSPSPSSSVIYDGVGNGAEAMDEYVRQENKIRAERKKINTVLVVSTRPD